VGVLAVQVRTPPEVGVLNPFRQLGDRSRGQNQHQSDLEVSGLLRAGLAASPFDPSHPFHS
jgi:hypothetical protein